LAESGLAMIEHLWSVLCSRILTDEKTRNISLIDIVGQVSVTSELPKEGETSILTIPLVLASMWRRSDLNIPTQGEFQIILTDPKGKELARGEMLIDLTQKHLRARTMCNFNGIPVTEAGTYRFGIHFRVSTEDEWRYASSVPLEVSFSGEPNEGE
jgi:hypothetical protein